MNVKAPRQKTRELLHELAQLPRADRIADPRTAEILRRWAGTIAAQARYGAKRLEVDEDDLRQEIYMRTLNLLRNWQADYAGPPLAALVVVTQQAFAGSGYICAVDERPRENAGKLLRLLERAQNRYYTKHGRPASPKRLSEYTGRAMRRVMRQYPRLVDPRRESRPIKGQYTSPPPAERLEKEEVQIIECAMNERRNPEMVRLILGWSPGGPKSNIALSRCLGVKKRTVSFHKISGLAKIREALEMNMPRIKPPRKEMPGVS